MPPAPTPCKVRPASSWVMVWDVQHTTVPTVKKRSDTMSSSRRPKMSDTAPMQGTSAALASRKDVPVQKVAADVPPSSWASVWPAVSVPLPFLVRREDKQAVLESESSHQPDGQSANTQGDGCYVLTAMMKEIMDSVNRIIHSCLPAFHAFNSPPACSLRSTLICWSVTR